MNFVLLDDLTHIIKNTSPKFIFTENIVLEKIKKSLNNSKLKATLVAIDEAAGFSSLKEYQKPTGDEDKFQ